MVFTQRIFILMLKLSCCYFQTKQLLIASCVYIEIGGSQFFSISATRKKSIEVILGIRVFRVFDNWYGSQIIKMALLWHFHDSLSDTGSRFWISNWTSSHRFVSLSSPYRKNAAYKVNFIVYVVATTRLMTLLIFIYTPFVMRIWNEMALVMSSSRFFFKWITKVIK